MHLVAVVHRVVAGCYLQSCLQFTIDDGVVLVAQVVATDTGNPVVAAKVATAYGRNEDRRGTFLLHGIDNLLQALLVGRRWRRASSVAFHCGGIRGIIFGCVVGLQFQVVYSIVFLIVVGELYEYIVAGLNVVLGIVPQFVVAAAGVAATPGIVHTGPSIGEEISEVHAPTTGVGGVFIIGCHGGVTQGVHFLGTDGHCALHEQQCNQSVDF